MKRDDAIIMSMDEFDGGQLRARWFRTAERRRDAVAFIQGASLGRGLLVLRIINHAVASCGVRAGVHWEPPPPGCALSHASNDSTEYRTLPPSFFHAGPCPRKRQP